MHAGKEVLGGPIWWFAVVLFVGTLLLCGFVALDALTPKRRERFAQLPESRWLYIIPSAVFVLAAIVVQFARSPLAAASVIIVTPLLLALGITYLLRVIFTQ